MTDDMGRPRTVTALFDSREIAEDAIGRLVAHGIGRERVSLVEGEAPTAADLAAERADAAASHDGFRASLANFFVPEPDRWAYAEGLRRGGYLVTVRNVAGMEHSIAVDILDADGAVDLDERMPEWEATGWSGYQAQAPVPPAASIASADLTRAEGPKLDRRDVSAGYAAALDAEELARRRVRSYAEEPGDN